ncbi:tetratricopeptide repeat protein, partial [Desulfovibrio sp. OttesenSCG-928-G11]|nr:tetratricopeptide repeat protein [Desulfovibrio sp. OttesenSCG-928-G11]
LKSDELQLLAQTGFLAVSTGKMVAGRRIFEGILALRPGNQAARMGLAMSHYMVDECEQAEQILRELLAEDDNYHLARAHLGLTLILAGKRDQALPFLEEAAKQNDPLFKDMVEELLEHQG